MYPVGSFNVFMNGMRPSSLGYTANFKIDAGMPDDLESNLRNTLPTTITRQENEDQFIIRRGETKNLTETNFLIPNCEERDFQL